MSTELGKLLLSTLFAVLLLIIIVSVACLIKKFFKSKKKSNITSFSPQEVSEHNQLRLLLLERAMWSKLYIDAMIYHSTKTHTDSLHSKLLDNSDKLTHYLRSYLDSQNMTLVNELLTEQVELILSITESVITEEKNEEKIKDLFENSSELVRILVSIKPQLSFDKIERLLQKQNEYLIDMIKSGVEKDWKKNTDLYQKYYDSYDQLGREF